MLALILHLLLWIVILVSDVCMSYRDSATVDSRGPC